MPISERKITPDDLLSDAEFAQRRKAWRAELLPVKRLRRIELGPYCTFYFECFDTMLFQVQEMLLIEKGGAAQVPDELAAYNPLIPKGSELVATVMFEIDDPVRREAVLARLGGAEDCFFVSVGGERVMAVPEGDIERTREDGKTSSVHFVRFPLKPEHIARFRDPATEILIGCSHERYSHLAGLSPATRAELSRDFA
jgi:hypothetical protein